MTGSRKITDRAENKQTGAVAPLFLAHGSPMLALSDIPARRFLLKLARDLPNIRGIVILSPHWETRGQRVSAAGKLKTIHDFRGFPPDLYEIQYPAEANADLVSLVMDQLRGSKIAAREDASWGLDHGAWVPLSLVYPELSVPVVELSVPFGSTPETIHALGRGLAPLAMQGIQIIGSGSTTHNLREIAPEGSEPAAWAVDFDAWVDEGLAAADISWFSDIEAVPGIRLAHPTEEHFLPLFFAMGAAGTNVPAELLHRSYSHGSLSMSYFRFPVAEAV
ncbi:DODA-type extradiol aromatic ring-opening family dioxygenase [Roseibium algae]|uniref:Class III extradiol ring-cleavage dioxygenase n=1 Tax=Roseibium algae TaxID=3123038 RepID=A0ABU8TLI2_9HYPH